MSRDIIEQATKVMHAKVCCPCDPEGCDWTETPEARYAWALADAGLLARPLPDREDIAATLFAHSEVLTEFPDGPVTCMHCETVVDGTNLHTDLSSHQADAVLALLKGQER